MGDGFVVVEVGGFVQLCNLGERQRLGHNLHAMKWAKQVHDLMSMSVEFASIVAFRALLSFLYFLSFLNTRCHSLLWFPAPVCMMLHVERR